MDPVDQGLNVKMDIGCTGSSSRASSVASRGSSRRSSTSSQLSESSRPRSALNSAYGAIRRLVSRKGSDKSRTDYQAQGNGSLDKDNPLLESESSLPTEKLKRQEHARFESASNDQERVSRSSQSPDNNNQNGVGCERKERSVTKITNRGNHTSDNKEHKKKVQNREREFLSSSDSVVEASRSLSDADILATRGIMLKRKLGEGTYAKVRSAYHTRLHRPGYVAVKIVDREKTNERYQRKFLPRELSVLRKIRHKNIIRLLEHFEHGQKVFMVMELANHGDLLEYIQRRRVLSDDRARYIFTQILDGLEYLHDSGVFHRDLKCENILLNTGYKVKITDFGFAREWWDAHNFCRTFCGSAAYASPEILQGIPYDPHVADIWSMGVILFIMITGAMPYDDSDVKKMLEIMAHNQLDFPRKRVVCFEVKTLLHSILYYFHRDRASIHKIRHSPWMKGICTMPEAETPQASTSSTTSAVVDANVNKTMMVDANPTRATLKKDNTEKAEVACRPDREDEKTQIFLGH